MKKIDIGKGCELIIDDKWWDMLKYINWRPLFLNGSTYATASVNNKTVYLHRVLMSNPKNMCVDHINRNGLDNRLSNLRVATASQNNSNRRAFTGCTSSFKGVCVNTKQFKSIRFRATIKLNNKTINLGTYDDEVSAAMVYDRAARFFHGSFSKTNSVFGCIQIGKKPHKRNKSKLYASAGFYH